MLKAIHICNSHQLSLQPKIAKEYIFANAVGQKKKKYDRTTRYIKHLADSANFKGGTLIKHRNGLIGNRFEMPNVSYTNPLAEIVPKNGKKI